MADDPAGGDGTAGDDASDAAAPRTVREERTPTPMRRTIARRLHESYRDAVHVTATREVDAEPLLAAVEALEERTGRDVSVTDLLIVAVSETLDRHPSFNATFEDDTHRLYEEHNVCYGVDIDAGLVAPVIPDVASLSVADLNETREALVDRVLTGDFDAADLRGGTFTVSNLGPLGVDSFTPVINPPQVAILGVNRIRERAVPADTADETVAFRRHLPLDLSFDHRVVDGADAARFLDTLADRIEARSPEE
ncbi:2-oxo acid dehydrogenase subunit E2 [Halobaculum litoreum]|uniref:2-oxo acid dehydrogenase subunit E2 n=1 Tax=Halobaculum litoreum TaxID=3031998 RepID=A0ABD5XXP3_9EURY